MHPTTTTHATRVRHPLGALLGALVAALLLTTGTPAPAQASEEAARPHPMAAIAGMVGTWTGEGWIQRGPERDTFVSREAVESRLEGEAILIEGRHHDAASGQVTHHALAMITWDDEGERYRFRSYVAGRGDGDFEGRIEDGIFVWGGPMGPGEMRYEITIEGDRWSEVGSFSQDGGETWTPFFGMELERSP